MKQFHYRGVAREFSNRYHFALDAPVDAAHWLTLDNAVVAAEKLIYIPYATQGAEIVRVVGYAGGSEIPVYTHVLTPVTGTASFTGYPPPGDCAGLIRYSTPDRSTKNHPIYCFNYYHAIWQSDATAGEDNVAAAQATLMATYATAWLSGFSDGTNVHRRSRPNGTVCTGAYVEPQLTHRDLPR